MVTTHTRVVIHIIMNEETTQILVGKVKTKETSMLHVPTIKRHHLHIHIKNHHLHIHTKKVQIL